MTYQSQRASWDQYLHECARDGSGFQRAFRRLLENDLNSHGIRKLLDIGCGASIPTPLAPLLNQIDTWDGVEPSPQVNSHPNLRKRWHGILEDAPIVPNDYPLALAYNVVEHIPHPEPFLRKVHDVLKPGGIFWALTPHSRHPFARLSRTIELLGLKRFMAWTCARRTGQDVVNDYPAYYRLNSPAAIDPLAATIGFQQATFYFFPSPQWSNYFPRGLRLFPYCYDTWFGNRNPDFALLMAMRLVK